MNGYIRCKWVDTKQTLPSRPRLFVFLFLRARGFVARTRVVRESTRSRAFPYLRGDAKSPRGVTKRPRIVCGRGIRSRIRRDVGASRLQTRIIRLIRSPLSGIEINARSPPGRSLKFPSTSYGDSQPADAGLICLNHVLTCRTCTRTLRQGGRVSAITAERG